MFDKSRITKLVVLLLLCFLAPGCQAVPTVPSGQVFYYRNNNFVPPNQGVTADFVLYNPTDDNHVSAISNRYTNVYVEGQTFIELVSLPIQKANYAVVGPNQLGKIDNFILPPGNYFRIPAIDVQFVEAVFVRQGNIGIRQYLEGNETRYGLLTEGIHAVLPDHVRIFPTGPLRYRLINADLLGQTSACQSTLCESTLSNVLTADSGVTVDVDLEVVFELSYATDSDLARLYQLNNVDTLMQTYLSAPIRTRGRSLFGSISPTDMQTQAGRILMDNMLLEFVTGEVAGQPIAITSVGVRGVDLPEEYLQNQQHGANEQQALEADMRNAELSFSATATANAFYLEQEQLRTQSIAEQMEIIRLALDSNDPLVSCGIINIFYPGSCNPLQPVTLTVDQSGE